MVARLGGANRQKSLRKRCVKQVSIPCADSSLRYQPRLTSPSSSTHSGTLPSGWSSRSAFDSHCILSVRFVHPSWLADFLDWRKGRVLGRVTPQVGRVLHKSTSLLVPRGVDGVKRSCNREAAQVKGRRRLGEDRLGMREEANGSIAGGVICPPDFLYFIGAHTVPR